MNKEIYHHINGLTKPIRIVPIPNNTFGHTLGIDSFEGMQGDEAVWKCQDFGVPDISRHNFLQKSLETIYHALDRGLLINTNGFESWCIKHDYCFKHRSYKWIFRGSQAEAIMIKLQYGWDFDHD